MTDLPIPARGNDHPQTSADGGRISAADRGDKEKEGGAAITPEFPVELSGKEIDLPKEVVAAGVRVRSTSVSLPANISRMGVVQPSGANVPPSGPVAVVLPLTDDQIAQGLRQSVTSSWRWLAVWCVFQLKRFHVGLKQIHGMLTRTRV